MPVCLCVPLLTLAILLFTRRRGEVPLHAGVKDSRTGATVKCVCKKTNLVIAIPLQTYPQRIWGGHAQHIFVLTLPSPLAQYHSTALLGMLASHQLRPERSYTVPIS